MKQRYVPISVLFTAITFAGFVVSATVASGARLIRAEAAQERSIVVGPKYVENPKIEVRFAPDEPIKTGNEIWGTITIRNTDRKPLAVPDKKWTQPNDKLGMQLTVLIKGQSASITAWYSCDPKADCASLAPSKTASYRIGPIENSAKLGPGNYQAYVFVAFKMPGSEDVRTKGVQKDFRIKIVNSVPF
jgi:hypothetical protein